MFRTPLLAATLVVLFAACQDDQAHTGNTPHKTLVTDNGKKIVFPSDKSVVDFFQTQTVLQENLTAEFTAPAQVVAAVLAPNMNTYNNVILFNNPELTTNYTQLLNHLASIKQKEIIIQQKKAIAKQKEAIIQQKNNEVDRFATLLQNGAATGKDLADTRTDLLLAEAERNHALTEISAAETELIAEKSAILEHEAKLKLAGFEPSEIVSCKAGKVWVICDIPENQINQLEIGAGCDIRFASYPNEIFKGKIESLGDVVDNLTRMIKMRISLPNADGRLRAGMFATVALGVQEHNLLTVPAGALVTVQSKHYVFTKIDDYTFVRKEVVLGHQINDRVSILGGIAQGDKVVISGVMQMKGLSFGY